MLPTPSSPARGIVRDQTVCWVCRVLVAVLSIVVSLAHASSADDWPQWRGPDRSNLSRETGLLKQWPAEPTGRTIEQSTVGVICCVKQDVGPIWSPNKLRTTRRVKKRRTADRIVLSLHEQSGD